MKHSKRYVGLDQDRYGGMTDTGKIIRDAWAFGLLPESETCEGWDATGLEALWRQVNDEWQKYGFQVTNLPDGIRERFMQIHQTAIERARAAGWDADTELDED